MKKTFLCFIAMTMVFTNLMAEENFSTTIVSQDETNSTTTTTTSSNSTWNDYNVTIDTSNKIYGLRIGRSKNSNPGYFTFAFSLGTGEYKSDSYIMGYGANYRHSNDNYMFQAAIFPYIGLYSYKYPEIYGTNIIKESKTEFTWGGAANITLGIKMYTTSKGTKGYLTFGYYVTAPEFETEGMFDRGCWCIGLSTNI